MQPGRAICRRSSRRLREPPVGTIIPLVPAPDDPGPDVEREIAPDDLPRQNGWRRWFR